MEIVVGNEAVQARARKDERPNTEIAIWRTISIAINGAEPTYALIKDKVAYFKHEEQWFKVNLVKFGIPVPKDGEVLYINTITHTPQSEEERKEKKKLRRQARRAARAVEELEDDEDEN